jgi:hypothetical protein
MANHEIRTVIAQALQIIHQDSGYLSPTKNTTVNTQNKVLAALTSNAKPNLEVSYWQLADDVIDFFRGMAKHPDYKEIMERADAPTFTACMEAAKEENVSTVNFTYVVLMPHLYAKLKPKKARVLNAQATEAKRVEPGQFLGTLHVPDRFFLKLVSVSKPDSSNGTLFELHDRVGNVCFFTDRVNNWESRVALSDCFAVHATPTKHVAAANGEKQTFFRNVEFLPGTIVQGSKVDPKNDKSENGKFSKGQSF